MQVRHADKVIRGSKMKKLFFSVLCAAVSGSGGYGDRGER